MTFEQMVETLADNPRELLRLATLGEHYDNTDMEWLYRNDVKFHRMVQCAVSAAVKQRRRHHE